MPKDSDRPTSTTPEEHVKGPLELVAEAAEFGFLLPALDEVKDAAKALNAVGDRANQRISFVEETLKQAGVGIEAWHLDEPLYERSYPLPHPPGLKKTTHLGYAKCMNTWGLAYRITSFTTDGKPTEVVLPLRNAERRIRVDAIRLIPSVLREVARALNLERSSIEKKLAGE